MAKPSLGIVPNRKFCKFAYEFTEGFACGNRSAKRKEQAGRIVVWIDKGELNMDDVQPGIEYALQNDKKRKIKEVVLLNKEGKEVKYGKI